MDSLPLYEYRCRCGKLLFKGVLFNGTLEIKCKRCQKISNIGEVRKIEDDKHYALLIDKNYAIKNESDSACRILGYSHEELKGKPFDFVNATFCRKLFENIFSPNSCLNEENYFRVSALHKCKNGQNIFVVSSLKLFKPDGKEKCVLVLSEVEKGMKDDPSLLKTKDKLFGNGCDFYFDIDKNGALEFMSPTLEKKLGFPEEEVLGGSYLNIISPKKRKEEEKIFNHFNSQEQPYRIVRDFVLTAEGKEIEAELYFTSKFDDLSNFEGYRVLIWQKKPEVDKELITS